MLLELINDLLDIATIEAGKTIQHRIPLDITQIMENTVALMSAKAEEKNIQITCSCRNIKSIHADPKGIEEVFSNLITNAVNYSPNNGKIEVAAEGLNEYIEIKVMDTGFGIPPEEISKIFDKFYRVKHPQTRQVLGTGLGLAIVKGIIEAHNGNIEVESIPDKGTTFKILLPIIK
jgi:signal transduction histidine kinase